MRIFFYFICLLLCPLSIVQAVQITHVHHKPGVFDPAKEETAIFQFHLSEPARAAIRIYDERDYLIREIESKKILPKGDHKLSWDGKDSKGRLVPPEAYHYTVFAVNQTGESVEHDLTDYLPGPYFMPRNVEWNPANGVIHYDISRPARVRVRIGLQEGGPLLRTLVAWVVRTPGTIEEPWDGWDEDHVLNLSKHPKLEFDIRAFPLPTNAVIVGPVSSKVELIQDLPHVAKRTPKKKRKKRMHAWDQQPVETRGEVEVELLLPDNLAKDDKGLLMVSGKVPLKIFVPEKDMARVTARRFELMIFVDGFYTYEAEKGYVPVTWMWDTESLNEGVHYITVNLRGYEGNFGITTKKVRVIKP